MGIHLRKPKPPEAKAAPIQKKDFTRIMGYRLEAEAPDPLATVMGSQKSGKHEDNDGDIAGISDAVNEFVAGVEA